MAESYLLANIELISPEPIPELLGCRIDRELSVPTEIFDTFKLVDGNSCSNTSSPTNVVEKFDIDGNLWLQVNIEENGYFFQFQSGVKFFLNLKDKTISLVENSEKDSSFTNHLLLDHVIPLYLSTQGYLVLHGSLVEKNGQGLLLLGISGSGKSSLAAALTNYGYRVLADDFSLVGEDLKAIASYPSLRIWPKDLENLSDNKELSSSTLENNPIKDMGNKRNISLEGNAKGKPSSTQLAKIILLSPDEELSEASFKEIPAQEKVISLIKSCFVLKPESPEQGVSQLKIASHLIKNTHFECISYPRVEGFQKELAKRLIETH